MRMIQLPQEPFTSGVLCVIIFVGPRMEKRGIIYEDNEEECNENIWNFAQYDSFVEEEIVKDDHIIDIVPQIMCDVENFILKGMLGSCNVY